MGITVAKTAGFCFGVDRAVREVYRLLDEGKKVYTLGPIIHNPQMIQKLEERGVEIIDSAENAPRDGTIVIRAHGVPLKTLNELKEQNSDFVDCTCPFVEKIHKIVANTDSEETFIFGNPDHPEIVGIVGHCKTPYRVFRNDTELEDFLKSNKEYENKKISIVFQTTFNIKLYEKIEFLLKKYCKNISLYDTICRATVSRQREAMELASLCDLMVVIGGRQSSNTVKLYDICSERCKTILIESSSELPLDLVNKSTNIGITAGASTPAYNIREALIAMSEKYEENFAELLEESLKSSDTKDTVKGIVLSVDPTQVTVEVVGRKQTGFVPANELSADPNVNPMDVVKVGDEMDLLIMRTNDMEGTMILSKKKLDSQKGWDVIYKALEDGDVLTGVVSEVVKGGVIVYSNGVRVFIPASQATASRNEPLEDLLKKEVQFKIIEADKGRRRRAVGSIRSVLRDARKEQAKKFWEDAEEGKEYEGTVKSLTNYGAFVDLGGIDGMVHISELSWNRIKHPSEVVNVGDTVKVYIKKLDKENGKISLGYKRQEDNPWTILETQYPVGTVCDVTIVGMTTFGAFAKIIPGIDGLIHISQISNERIEKPQDVLKEGDVVKAKITDIDLDKKRVSLSIRAAMPQEEAAE